MPGIVLNQVEWEQLSTEKEYLYKDITIGWHVGIFLTGKGFSHLLCAGCQTTVKDEIENGKIYELPE
jgi:hypothetical protein